MVQEKEKQGNKIIRITVRYSEGEWKTLTEYVKPLDCAPRNL